MITAYDSCMAALADEAGIDVVLVGDSVGNVMHGFETTLPVTMDMMVMHTRAVRAGARRALVVADMPFMSYQVSVAEAIANAGRLVKEGGAAAVKIENCGRVSIEAIRAIVDVGIPVMGHVGLTPQSVHALGGYRVQGRDEQGAQHIADYAREVQDAGAFAIVLELMSRDVARAISASLAIPTIGIGAGADCDGQVLVLNDMLGLTDNPPRFVKKYADLRAGVLRAIRKYARDVRERTFPADEHGYD
jgi:3-methyl-2-oxobutanoate hydroxymethyltransferase